jgi:hypothetical protein
VTTQDSVTFFVFVTLLKDRAEALRHR